MTDRKTDAAISTLSEFILRERKVTKKGEVAGAHIEVQSALRDIATCQSVRQADVVKALRKQVNDLKRENDALLDSELAANGEMEKIATELEKRGKELLAVPALESSIRAISRREGGQGDSVATWNEEFLAVRLIARKALEEWELSR